jgi:hypothetical protein
MTTLSSDQSAPTSRYLTREQLLAVCAERERNGTGEPAHDEATRYVPVAPKMQAALDAMEKARKPMAKAQAVLEDPNIQAALALAAKAQAVLEDPNIQAALALAAKVAPAMQARHRAEKLLRPAEPSPRFCGTRHRIGSLGRSLGRSRRPTPTRTRGSRRGRSAASSSSSSSEPGEPPGPPLRRGLSELELAAAGGSP